MDNLFSIAFEALCRAPHNASNAQFPIMRSPERRNAATAAFQADSTPFVL